ncbi:hypothetical protein K501DRAFT_278959 [Backusella circina FSU 941]|nr:hypothetical protein K501DRAFT_280505 [Backusella circina FSU 941]KAI8876893.1 hypothetical protein K501DRAFT_278959 [Backusella circina FSU 941]
MSCRLNTKCTNKLTGYIVDEKISITAASRKVNISRSCGSKYYHRCLNDPNNGPRITDIQDGPGFPCMQDKINKLISYIVDDKVSILVASRKTKMSRHTDTKYYQQHSNYPSHNIPTSSHRVCHQTSTHDQIKTKIMQDNSMGHTENVKALKVQKCQNTA